MLFFWGTAPLEGLESDVGTADNEDGISWCAIHNNVHQHPNFCNLWRIESFLVIFRLEAVQRSGRQHPFLRTISRACTEYVGRGSLLVRVHLARPMRIDLWQRSRIRVASDVGTRRALASRT